MRRVIDHYENQSDEEATAEDEEALDAATHAVMEVHSSYCLPSESPSPNARLSEGAA
jgi:hypothetical protein